MISSAAAAFYLAWTLIGAAAPADDPCTAALEVRQFSFEFEDDQDYDNQPDDWTRRRGKNFPHYVQCAIDRKVGFHGRQSLRFDLNGAQAAYYAPLIPVNAAYSYVFRGRIRTDGLQHDAALVSISLLDHRRRRIRRILSRPVTGTHAGWVTVNVGPLRLEPEIRFLVIGCHVAAEENTASDIRGQVWFDDLWLGSLPRIEVTTVTGRHYFNAGDEIQVQTEVLGLQPKMSHELTLRLKDGAGRVLESTSFPLPAQIKDAGMASEPLRWTVPRQENGFYRVEAALGRAGVLLLEKEMTFAVMAPIEPRTRGEFGWSMSAGTGNLPPADLADIAAQSGINWLKIPLWSIFDSGDRARSEGIARLMDRAEQRGITLVGLLNDPPRQLTEKFAQHWVGVSKIFTMPRAFWYPSIESIIAGYSFRIRHWQLGSETDDSFVGLPSLAQTIESVKAEFDRIGNNTRLGYHWKWTEPFPAPEVAQHSFLALSSDPPLPPERLQEALQSSASSGIPRWVLLRPMRKGAQGPLDRSADLARQMIAAKLGGADSIFISDPLDAENGLLNVDGSPTELFLPCRTIAATLAGFSYLGQVEMPNRSSNAVFARDAEVVIVFWNDVPVREQIYLGEQARVTDLRGRSTPVATDSSGQQFLDVGPTPLIVGGCSAGIARWRLAVQFEHGRIRSEYGGHEEAVLGANTFSQGVSGRAVLHMPPDWEVEPNQWVLQVAANEKFRLPTLLTFPADASLGKLRATIDFEISADRPYKFTVYLPYQLGMGDVTMNVSGRRANDGRIEIEQIITNTTEPLEVLDFNCSLFIPGQIRQKQVVTKLGKGQDKRFYHIPFTDSLRGKALWLRAEQIDGRRVLNYHWKVPE